MFDVAQKYIFQYLHEKRVKKFHEILDNFLGWKWNYRGIFSRGSDEFQEKFDELREEMDIEYWSAQVVYLKLLKKYTEKFFADMEQEFTDPPHIHFVKKLLKINVLT